MSPVHHIDFVYDAGSNTNQEKKEEIWLSPMIKAPTPAGMSKGQSDNTNNVTKKLDYTAVADRLRTVSWSNYGHPNGVVILVYEPNLPNPHNSRLIKKIWQDIPSEKKRIPMITERLTYDLLTQNSNLAFLFSSSLNMK